MSTTEAPSTRASESAASTDFIRRKINQTRRSVKLAELVAGLLLFAAGSLLFLLGLALVDHWIVGLSFVARLVAFVVYVVAGAAFLWVYVVPLLFQSINPLYAARIIEQGQPTLKNSLLNFLFLSKNQQGTRRAVLDAIESQAAADMSSLKLEHLVDYTKAIRMGYVLAALAVVFGLYQMLSPKDPLQTAARVAMPWTDIARPSRVNIVEVQPGDTSIYQGEELEVVATIYDVAPNDKLQVVYSTKDGQLVDQTVALEPRDDGVTYTATFTTSESGIQQDLTYRLEAGDAVTRSFEVTTLEAPSIDVTALRYEFPAYTQQPPREQTLDGQIQALEGTMITVRATANRPIAKAYIEFDPQDDASQVSLNTIAMQASSEDDRQASARFPIELNAAGTTGKYRSYQVRFRTEDGVLNPHPVVYPIDTIRDLSPEVEILEPSASEVEVPENGSLPLRVRALDPDFAIRQVHVHGTRNEKRVVDAALLDQPKAGQVLVTWDFVPREHQLQSGDVIELIAIAEDNKTTVAGKPNPNLTKSRRRVVRIVDPIAGRQAEQPKGSGAEQGQEQQPGQEQGEKDPQKGETGQDGDQGESGEKSGDQGEQGEGGESGEGEPQPNGEKGSQGESGQEGESGEQGMNGQSGEMQEGEATDQSQPSDGQGSGSSSQPMNEPSQEGQQEGQQSDGQQAGSSQDGKSQDGPSQPGQGRQGQSQENPGDDPMPSEQQGTGGSGGKAASEPGSQQNNEASNQGDGTSGRGTGKPGDPTRGGELQQGDASTQPNENSQVEKQDRPVASDGSQDGDAFERIQQYLKENQPTPSGGDGTDQPPQQQPPSGDEGEGQQMPQNGQQDAAGADSQGQSQGSQQESRQNGQPAGQQGEQPSGPSSSPAEAENQSGEGGQAEGSEMQQGQRSGQQPEQPGVDNGARPEKSAPGQDASQEQDPAGAPGSTDNNEGESIERDTQNNEQGAGENKGGAIQKETDANRSDASERAGDTGQGDNTDSGAGMESNKDDTGSPQSSEMPNKQSPNDMAADQQANDEEGDQAKSPSTSNKQSQSQGDNRGDVSGGGKSGGGQSAKQAGNDSAGSTSAGDEGAGAAQQQGEGETGQEGGDGPQADQQTGSAGTEKGAGSQASDTSPEGQPGPMGQPAESSTPEGQQPEGQQQPPRDPQQSASGPGNSAIPQGGGLEGDGTPQTWDGPREEPGADEANLDYAKQATDMVLERLKHQQNNPDKQLLDDLGWTQEDFQRFVQRWQKMKAAAEESPEASRELNDALRSLGLSRGEDRVRQVESRQSTAGGSGDIQRSAPPPSFLEQYRAYLKGASQ